MELQRVGHDWVTFSFRKGWTILDLGARQMENKNLQFQHTINLENLEQINWKLQYSIISIISEKCTYMYTREWKVKVKVAQLCPTLFNPWNSSGQNTGMGSLSLLQRISQPRDRTQVSHIAGGFSTNWSIREAYAREYRTTKKVLLTPGGSDSKESACSAGDPGSIPGSQRSPTGGNCYSLQYSCLENSMDRAAWVAKKWTWLND